VSGFSLTAEEKSRPSWGEKNPRQPPSREQRLAGPKRVGKEGGFVFSTRGEGRYTGMEGGEA